MNKNLPTVKDNTARVLSTFLLRIAMIALASRTAVATANAGFATPGQGLATTLVGSVPNGALFWGTQPVWINSSPAMPYTNQVMFALPACDSVVTSRLVMTVWGGTANYTCRMNVQINGSNLPGTPFVFGTTSDSNPVFCATQPCAYGAGSGLWLVALPVPGNMLARDGSSNSISIVETSPDSFDGRLHHVTLVAVYQSAKLNNTFGYALAEGSGDIYGAPASPQVDQRTVTLGAVNPANATTARLTALYTYGDTGQNDRLFFNGAQLGGDDIAQWDKTGTGLSYGPSVMSFDVLANLQATNTVKFSVSATDVPGTRETSLRPQLAALAVTRPITAPMLAVTVQSNQACLTITGETNRTYTVLCSANLLNWDEAASFVSSNSVSQWLVPATNATRFFRVQAR